VMAHEVTHIVNRDVATMTLASFFATIASMIVQFGLFFGGGFGGGYGDDDDGGGMSGLALVAIGAVVWLVSYFLMMALSRYREFAADRGAATLTGRPMALASALEKISGGIKRMPQTDKVAHTELNAFYIFPAQIKGSLFNLFSTHPPMEKRIAELTKLDMQLRGASGIFGA
jgi:heat shock protein HtpX